MIVDKLKRLVAVSNRYGGNPDFVLAGGGNTSVKIDGRLYVKASGTTLAEIAADGFVCIELSRLTAIMAKEYPEASEDRETEALADLMDSRCAGESKRPSVETLLHGILPYTYVVHTHPALVNGLTCSRNGAAVATELFGSDALFVPVVNPGYILAKTVNEMLAEHRAAGGTDQIIFLENHGLFIQADTIEEIDQLYRRVVSAIAAKVTREPAARLEEPVSPTPAEVAHALRAEGEFVVSGGINADILMFSADAHSFAPLALSFTPDHIVYCGFKPLFCADTDRLVRDYRAFSEAHGTPPKVLVLQGGGFYTLGKSLKSAELIRDVFFDGVRIAVYTESFGGYSFMPADKIDFIRNWEVEQYRSSISAG